ncbi:MAG TPA: TonB-dependent receptor [Steroidobacteraceae bacterium]|nr:TonB-dependent receptor [Steroidobacteraceae bacterium]
MIRRTAIRPDRSAAAPRLSERPNPALGRLPLASAISAILAGSAPLVHADTTASDTLEEVVVTAQKVTENLQNVPVSIETLSTQKLEQLNIVNLDTYVEYLSGVTTIKSIGQGGNGVGTTHVYMRGINSGQDGNHSGSQPTVGTYLDEQPVTTIDGTVDIHTYDIARVEVLEGPQGTLYGASSEAGTIRIITNKPDPTKFEAAYQLSGNTVDHGGQGWEAEGFVNIPLGAIAAVRIVGWDEHDAGYIDNVRGTNRNAGIVDGQRSFQTWTGATGLTLSSTPSSNYNTSETKGGRMAVKLDLGNWTVTPSFIGQSIASNGYSGFDPAVGDLQIVHFGPENDQDSFTQTALTVEGKVSNFDITYAGAWFTRAQRSIADYADYSYFYDKYYGSGAFWTNNAGLPAEPQEFVLQQNHFTKMSNELRLSTPQDLPLKGVIGLFEQRQVHEIWQDYVLPGLNGNPYTFNPQGLAQAFDIPGLNNNSIWLTDEERVDRDYAAFAQVTWDFGAGWSLTGGFRQYRYDNSLQGFYGYALGYTGPGEHSGQATCGPPGKGGSLITQYPNYAPFHFAPCTDLNLTAVSANGHTDLLRLSYKFDPDHMMYGTFSTGFRPGGVNRVFDKNIGAIYPPYGSDELKNYEIGWKTQWFQEHLRWNGALFWEEWKNFQFSYLGPNSVTVVQNAASARSRGIESNFELLLGSGFTLSGSATFLDAKLTSSFCGTTTLAFPTSCPNQPSGASGSPITFADGSVVKGPYAPSGSPLPGTPRLKLNLIGRYNFSIGDWNAYGQAAYVYQDASVPLMFPIFYNNGPQGQQHLGTLPPYSLVNLAGGVGRNNLDLTLRVENVFDNRGEITRIASCTPTTCNQPYVFPVQPRTIWVQVAQKF